MSFPRPISPTRSPGTRPNHLFSVEAFEAAKRRLKPDGVVAVHVISYSSGKRGALRRAVERTLGEVFENVRILVANNYPDLLSNPVNLILFASDGRLEFEADPRASPYRESLKRSPLAEFRASVTEQCACRGGA